jgi:two-component system nitrogen regulation sensor histidine kinase NtrY
MNLKSSWFFLIAVVLLGVGLAMRAQYSSSYDSRQASDIEGRLAAKFNEIEREASELLEHGVSDSSRLWATTNNFFLHVGGNKVLAWSRNEYFSDIPSLLTNDDFSFTSASRGNFLSKSWRINDGTNLICVLRLTDRYPIANSFLSPQWNPALFETGEIDILSPAGTIGEPVTVNGKTIFRIVPEKHDAREGVLSFLLLLGAIIAFCMAVMKVTNDIARRYSYDAAFLFLFISLLTMRIGMILLAVPALFFPSAVFDPREFASSALNASVGDLLLNALALLMLIIYLFVHFKKFRLAEWIIQLSGTGRYLAGTVCLLVCFLAFLFPYDFVEAIYHNSALSLDIAQSIAFNGVRVVAIASVLTACFTSFLFINVFFSLANHLFGKQNSFFLLALLVAALLFAAEFYITGRILWTTLALGLFYFSVLKLSALSGVFRVSFQLFIYLIFSLSVFSIQNALAIRLFHNERQVRDQVRFGKDFLTERDVLGEYLLDQARKRIEQDQFIQTRMASPFLSKAIVADKIRRVHLSNYFDRYEVSIVTKSEDQKIEDNFDNGDSTTWAVSAYVPTGYEGISYAKAADGNTVKRYHVNIPLFFQRPVGVVTLDLSLKRVIPENVYPELLVDNRFSQIYRNRDFSYAVFSKGKVISSFGPFNYQRDFSGAALSTRSLYTDGVTADGYFHIGIEDTDGTIAVVSASVYAPFYFITNFSFWFVLGLAVLFIGQAVVGVNAWLNGEQVNYSARIQLFVFLAFLLPVVAVSITTLTLIGKSSEETIKNDFLERSGLVAQRIGDLLAADSVAFNRETRLETWIEENAAASKIDISIYSSDGALMATSQPALFENQLVSPLIHRTAWNQIVVDHDVQTVTNEEIGNLQYSCAYSAVRSPDTGQLLAIVALPFFESAAFLQKSQSLIFSNILIVFVIVFILFSMLSFWASRSLTYPIRFITKTLGQTTLNGQNKPLQWNSSDEIGTLIKEYNRMVENLEGSRKALAQTEKESAWREMAKQVAHEIKNPLTPMKLTLQQMEQSLQSGGLSSDKSRKSVDVLLKQVDILNQIAASFSSFANMPAPAPKLTDLNALILSSVNLFAAEKDARIVFASESPAVQVLVDPTSVSRAISNIIINALQARRDGIMLEVRINTKRDGDRVTIALEDNGKGIPPSIRDRIFQPQFTTKQSGSGLGLAMARQIISHAGGSITFESDEARGTTFLIVLPIADTSPEKYPGMP